jgi:hypothetical protein
MSVRIAAIVLPAKKSRKEKPQTNAVIIHRGKAILNAYGRQGTMARPFPPVIRSRRALWLSALAAALLALAALAGRPFA